MMEMEKKCLSLPHITIIGGSRAATKTKNMFDMKKRMTPLGNLRKAVAIALLAVATWSGTQAAPISREQALRQARQLLQQRGDTRQLVAVDDLGVAPARRTQQGDVAAPPYYVFNRGMGEGYVIVSGDDATSQDILGYCDNGTFNYEQLPPNMQEWLDDYAAQIARLQDGNASYASSTSYSSSTSNTSNASISSNAKAPHRIQTHPRVEQLMSSQWSQGSPYNDECPEYFNLGRSVTGCVATAYAQILYYHREKMPIETQASMPAYDTWTSHPTYGQLHVEGIPAGSPIDWEHMRDTYGDFILYGIGDSINDLPLLEASDVSYTFPYAPEICRQRADKVVDTIVDALEDSLRY